MSFLASSIFSPREEDINNEVLIQEVQQRPILYDKSLEEYSDVNIKRRLWREVCAELFPSVWESLTEYQKIKAVRGVQKRFKNLRASLSREIRAQRRSKSGQASSKRRKYIYYEKLLFLLPHLENHMTNSNSFVDIGEFDKFSETAAEEATDPLSKIPYCMKSSTEELLKDENTTSPTNSFLIKQSYENSRLEENSDTPSNNLPRLNSGYEENLFETISKNNMEPIDQETHFALSLVPILKILPLEKKLEAQIQILQVFKNINSST